MVTDENRDGATSGATDDTAFAGSDERAALPMPPDQLPTTDDQLPEAGPDAALADDAALIADGPDATLATDDTAAADDESQEPEDEARRRPPLAVIIGSVLLLVVIGAGLAFLIPSGASRAVEQVEPTADPAVASEAPTAPPLTEVAAGDPTDVIAQVGDGQITRGDFARLYEPGSSPDDLLNQLIQVELVVQAGNAEGVQTDDAKLTAQIDQIKLSQAGGDPAQFEAFLAQAKIGTEDDLRRLLARDQIVEAMILRYTTGEQARARHILIATETVSDTNAAKLQAEELVKQLDDGADFAALAAENSADTGSAANGGDLGWALKGSYVPEFDEAVFTMQPGERRLVQTQFGYHIIEVLDPAETSGLKSSDMLQTAPGQEAFATTFIPWVDELKRKADEAKMITILIPAESLVVAAPPAPAVQPTTTP